MQLRGELAHAALVGGGVVLESSHALHRQLQVRLHAALAVGLHVPVQQA